GRGDGDRGQRSGADAGAGRSGAATGRLRAGPNPGRARLRAWFTGWPAVPAPLGNAGAAAPGRSRCGGRGLRARADPGLPGDRPRAVLSRAAMNMPGVEAEAPPLELAVQEALADGGALAQALPCFVSRPAQQELSAVIAQAFECRDSLLAEAGTGTGKTFAYLVPALLSGLKTIVSTGTKALQDQLFHRDLPAVRDALGVNPRIALLKGRANYLCRHRLERARGEPRFSSRDQVALFQRVVAWAGRTRMGDLADLEALPEGSPLIPMVTSTVDNCLGSECPFWSECFVVQARQRAQSADLGVVNHHLLLADLARKQQGCGEILPGAQASAVDAAHQAPAQALEQSVRALRERMEALPVRGTLVRLQDDTLVQEALDEVSGRLQALARALEPLREGSPALDACHARAVDFSSRLQRWRGTGSDADDDDVRWYELSARGFRLQRTPLDVAGPLRAHREASLAAWVFTSATLAVDGRFDHIASRLGLEAPRTLMAPGPFDWPSQALCYLPPGLPAPASRDYSAAVLDAVLPVLHASGGRAFLLF